MNSLPDAGTMAAELVGDFPALTDDRLRRLQALSDAPEFRCTGLAADFESVGIDSSWLVVTKRGWSMPEVGRLGHSIAKLPLVWTGDDSRVLLSSDPSMTSAFTGFEKPFTPSIAQRLSAALGILNIDRQQEKEFGEGIIRKCQEDISAILVRFPVLMHTAFRSINYQGSRRAVTRVPLSYALQKAVHSRLPSKDLGVGAEDLKTFANHPVVRASLTTPLTHAQLADCGPWQDILKDSYLSGAIEDVAHGNFTFAIDAHHFGDLVAWKPHERRYSPFLETAHADGFKDSINAKNDNAIRDLIGLGMTQAPDAVLPALQSIRTAVPPVKDPHEIVRSVCVGIRSHNTFTNCVWEDVLQKTCDALQVCGIDVDAKTVAAHFVASPRSQFLNEQVDARLLSAAVTASGGVDALRTAIGVIGAILQPVWEDALKRIEVAERMTRSIEECNQEAGPPSSRRRRASL